MARTKKSGLVKQTIKNVEVPVENEVHNTPPLQTEPIVPPAAEADTKPLAKGETYKPVEGDTIVINADIANKFNFEIVNLEMLDGKVMLGKNTANVINVFETIYNTLVNAVDPDYPKADFLANYKDKMQS